MAALTRFQMAAPRPLALGLAVALAVSGCTNPFKPATPAPPNAQGLRADYSNPEKVVQTLAAAMAYKASGATAWMDAMALASGPYGEFVALQDPVVLDKWRISSQVAPPNPWGVEVERTFSATSSRPSSRSTRSRCSSSTTTTRSTT